MIRKAVCCFVAVVIVSMVRGQNQQGMTECQNSFLQNINTCFQNSQLVFNNFLWLMSNGTNGQAPDNADKLKKDACSKKDELIQCGVEFMKTMINSTMCAPSQTSQQDQRPMVDRQFRTLFGSMDEMCAHPCRHTLAEGLRQCYVDAELDPNLFLSNSTMGRGAVIGTKSSEVNDFCAHKEALISCMKQKRDDCPESPLILRAIGLDIDSMDKGVTVLCAHKDVYLTGLDCFAEPTEAVVACQRTLSQKTVELMMSSQQQNLPEEQFFSSFCDIRLEHVGCDLESWSKKNHESCSKGVIGLRTELECGLLPDNCASSHKQMIDQVCHHDNFKRQMRPISGGNSFTRSVTTSVFVSVALISTVLSLH